MWVLGVFFMKIEIAKRFSENPLDDCNLVYLDTNFGLQIRWEIGYKYHCCYPSLFRKLYEPHLYPGAQVLKVFDEYFGDFQTNQRISYLGCKISNLNVCAVGLEPNPKHVEYLQRMCEASKSCVYRVVINTRVGVGAHSSTAEVRRPLGSFERSRSVFSSWRLAVTWRETGALMWGRTMFLEMK